MTEQGTTEAGAKMTAITCECAGPQGFRNLGTGDNQWWVHDKCGKPTEPWLHAKGDDMLNLFRGGPLDGAAYTTSTLLDPTAGERGWGAQIAEYLWTPEIVVSERTGASARVWVHRSLAPTLPQEQQGSTTDAVAGSTSPVPTEKENTMTEQAAATPGNTLEDRRKALKLSRKQVSVKSGLTEAKVARIEKEGARTTEDEKTQVAAALDALEKEQAAAAAEAPAADPA